MCFEAPPDASPAALAVILAQVECVIDLNRLVAFLDDPKERHRVPAAMREIVKHQGMLFDTIALQMPDAHKAFRAGLVSTNDLHAQEKAAP